MQIMNTTAETPAMTDPRLIERALIQTWKQGSEYAVIPFHSYEAWAHCPGTEWVGFWHEVRTLCFSIDIEWDDELMLICLKLRDHAGECGKPGHRHLCPAAVE